MEATKHVLPLFEKGLSCCLFLLSFICCVVGVVVPFGVLPGGVGVVSFFCVSSMGVPPCTPGLVVWGGSVVSIGVGLCVWLLWRLRLPCLGLNGVVWREFFLFLFSVPVVKSCMSLVVLVVVGGVPPRVPLGVRIMFLRGGVLF